MDANETRRAIATMALSQGCWGRMLRDIDESEYPDEVYAGIGEGCDDMMDVVRKIEGW